MSIVRVGLAETKNFAEGYDAIFGKKSTTKTPAKKNAKKAKTVKAPKSKSAAPKKKTAKKK